LDSTFKEEKVKKVFYFAEQQVAGKEEMLLDLLMAGI
jgi:hypothetical protein